MKRFSSVSVFVLLLVLLGLVAVAAAEQSAIAVGERNGESDPVDTGDGIADGAYVDDGDDAVIGPTDDADTNYEDGDDPDVVGPAEDGDFYHNNDGDIEEDPAAGDNGNDQDEPYDEEDANDDMPSADNDDDIDDDVGDANEGLDDDDPEDDDIHPVDPENELEGPAVDQSSQTSENFEPVLNKQGQLHHPTFNHHHHHNKGPVFRFRCHPAHLAAIVLLAVALGAAARRVRRHRNGGRYQPVTQSSANAANVGDVEVPVVVVMGKLKEDDDGVSHDAATCTV